MKFTRSHEWICLDGIFAFIGVTSHVKTELGEIVFIALPKVGFSVKAGDEICVLESTKAAVDVYSPVSGKIIAVNDTLKTSLVPINQSSEATGWICQIELSLPEEYNALLSKEEYDQLTLYPK